jgi:hypothetical protein
MSIKKTTIFFSINVHENLNFLQKQIEDIEANVLLDFVILINANEFMYNEIMNSELLQTKSNVLLYPEPINKIYCHGTIVKGIYLNMEYAVRNYQFEYFVVLSSRNLFYNTLHKDNYRAIPKICDGEPVEQLCDGWHWNVFVNTKLGKYIIANNLRFCSPQWAAGLTFDYTSSIQIVDFLIANEEIKEDLFNFNAVVEEFALQSISLNLSGYYYNIGNWAATNTDDFVNIHKLPSDRFVYVTLRK